MEIKHCRSSTSNNHRFPYLFVCLAQGKSSFVAGLIKQLQYIQICVDLPRTNYGVNTILGWFILYFKYGVSRGVDALYVVYSEIPKV